MNTENYFLYKLKVILFFSKMCHIRNEMQYSLETTIGSKYIKPEKNYKLLIE